MDDVARIYVGLVLEVGEVDGNYVDAFYGPAAWRDEARARHRSLVAIRADAVAARDRLGDAAPSDGEEVVALRHAYLRGQLASLIARVDQLAGRQLPFDEESRALYDAVAPHHDEAYFAGTLVELAAALPGGADDRREVPDRLEELRAQVTIPADRLAAVFDRAIAECRARTSQRLALPTGESFTVEYVTDKPWSAYNWYQGGYRSVIQVNAGLPILIDRAVDLACHEGYPGHHVYNLLLEQHLVNGRGWPEFSVYPLFSPQSLIAEGTANFGIAVAFPAAERLAFERDVLYPLAGLDPAKAAVYDRVHRLLDQLSYAGNEAARRYLDGAIDAQQATDWLVRFALMSPARAAQRIGFFDTYRSYVINYNLGQDLVRGYVEARGGTAEHPDRRWQIFLDLLSSPRLPSALAAPLHP
jgi:hypothetical protein